MTIAEDGEMGVVRDAAVRWREGLITHAGAAHAVPTDAAEVMNGGGCWITPGFIDCHTHLVHAGDRAAEWDMRQRGVSYAEIAAAGGGILSTVRATRAASEDELLAESRPRLDALMCDGVTTVEIKSGYGLDLSSEAVMLRVARRLGEENAVSVATTFLGAHALPPEFVDQPDAYITHLIDVMLPALVREGLVDAVDAFCESIAFTPAQVERVFRAAQHYGLPVKLHAEQLSDSGGATMAAPFGALSCDHLEYLSEAGVNAMRDSGTVAVMLPGAFYFLRETKLPPISKLRAAGVPMAVATDLNPGTSPIQSLRVAMNMAVTLFGMSPAEVFAGVTVHAARALGLNDRGRIAPGLRADLALWHVAHPAALIQSMGDRPLAARVVAGNLAWVRG
jgi:imidazolonepropionase